MKKSVIASNDYSSADNGIAHIGRLSGKSINE